MSSRAALAAACSFIVVLGACTVTASASVDMETGIADDAQLLYSGPVVAARTVTAWQKAGVDVVRVHARWGFIAPGVHSTRAPSGFRAADPDDPHYNWGRLDRAVSLLTAAGIRPMIALTGSGPLWASRVPSLHNTIYEPDPRAFGAFAHAVAARYAGVVHRYLIWNEPNQGGWLQPQFRCAAHRCVPRSPAIYRALFRASSAQIAAVDPSAEVLIGTLAPRGRAATRPNAAMHPLAFLRALGCVDSSYKRIRSGDCASSRPLRAFGFAYHPHPVKLRPQQHSPNPDDASIGDLGRLEIALDRTTLHGILKPTYGRRFNLYLTEFGYQTNPPDKASGVTLRQQADWVQQAYYIGYRDPRIRNITGYLWRDEPLFSGRLRYAGWQSGLYFAGGIAKPLRRVFEHPFYVDTSRGRAATFWGQIRPGGTWDVQLERRGSSGWQTVATRTTNPWGYWTVHGVVRTTAAYRFQYTPDPASDTSPPTGTSATQRVVRTAR